MFKEDIIEEVKIIIEWVETFNYKEELEKIKIYEDNEDNEKYNIINGVLETPNNNNFINNIIE